MGISVDGSVSPEVLRRMVYAGVHNPSFRQAEQDLRHLADLKVGHKQIERWTRRVGELRLRERTASVERWSQLPLPEMIGGCPLPKPPEVAVVQMDGGRLQIFNRSGKQSSLPADEESTAEPVCEAQKESASSFWRESKIGCLATMHSQVHSEDPRPGIPQQFLDPPRILKLSREIRHNVPVDHAEDETTSERAQTEQRAQAPKVLVKSVVATKQSYCILGLLLAAAAWTRGFATAPRKAFIADGAAINWTIWKRHFSHYTPIVDFIHAISYLFAAAMAGRPFAEGWPTYCRWAQALWSGQVPQIIEELKARQEELGLPEQNAPAACPRRIVAEGLTYLCNHEPYMDYASYRKQGLPLTSSLIESTVKQVSRRVKGTEKFWSEPGSESILQLRADYLSDMEPMDAFWERWQTSATGQRTYSTAT